MGAIPETSTRVRFALEGRAPWHRDHPRWVPSSLVGRSPLSTVAAKASRNNNLYILCIGRGYALRFESERLDARAGKIASTDCQAGLIIDQFCGTPGACLNPWLISVPFPGRSSGESA